MSKGETTWAPSKVMTHLQLLKYQWQVKSSTLLFNIMAQWIVVSKATRSRVTKVVGKMNFDGGRDNYGQTVSYLTIKSKFVWAFLLRYDWEKCSIVLGPQAHQGMNHVPSFIPGPTCWLEVAGGVACANNHLHAIGYLTTTEVALSLIWRSRHIVSAPPVRFNTHIIRM